MTDKPKNIQEALAEVRRKSLVEQEPLDIVKKAAEKEKDILKSGPVEVAKGILQRAQEKASSAASDLYRDWANSETRQKLKDVQKQIVKDVDIKAKGYEYKREDPTAPVGRAERGPGDKVFKKGKTINTGETDSTSGKYLERVVKENDNPLIDAFLRLHELTAFEKKFAQEMKRQHGPGERKTFDWHGTKIALKYATDKPKPAAPAHARSAGPAAKPAPAAAPAGPAGAATRGPAGAAPSAAPSAPSAAPAGAAPSANGVEMRPVRGGHREAPYYTGVTPTITSTSQAAEDRAAEKRSQKSPPNSDFDPFGVAKAMFGPLATGKQYDWYTGREKQAKTNEEFSLSSIFGQKTEKPRDVSDKEFPLSTNYRLPPKMHQDMVKNYMDKAVSPVGITNKSASPQKYNFPSPVDVQKGRVLNVDRALSKINNPDHVMASDPERLKKPVATIPFQMKEYLDRTSGKPPMKEDVSSTVKDLYNRAKEAITGSSKGDRVTPSEPERSTEIFKAAPGSKESIGMSDYPGKNIGQGNKFSSRVPKDDDKPMSGISPAPKPMGNIAPAPKPKPYFDYQNRQYRGVPPHQTGKGRAIDSNRETYLEQKSTQDEGKRKKMSEENSPIIDMFLKLQEKNALSPNIFEAAKKMSAKEKSLASLGHPKDKITKKDVLIGRGVLPKEVDEGSIYSGKNPFAPGGPNSPIGPGGSENFGRAVTVEKEPKPARPADSAKPKSFVDPKNPTVQGSGDITFDGRPTRVKEGMEDIEAPKYRSAEDVKKAKQPNGYEYKFDTDTKSTFERMRGLSGKDAKVMEELKGNQHRIDANKNGKIDSEDFKLLRSKKKMEEEVEFSQAEIDHINSFFEAVAPNRPEPTKGVNPTVRNTDLTDETLDELKKPPPETALKVVNRANDRDEWSAKAANRLYSRYKKGYEPKEKKTGVKEEQIAEGRPKKNPEPASTERDAREHIQVQAGRAAGGTVVDFKHDNGKVSKLTPGMGRSITAHLNGLKPAERQEAVKRMHASPEGLKV